VTIDSNIKNWLQNLRTDRSNPWPDTVRNQAPHKPFLLLSILDGIEQGWITSNEVELSQKLIDTFFVYWNGIMGEHRFTTIALPFFHMASEPFWKLSHRPGKERYKSSPSVGGLHDRVKFAVINPDLFELMITDETRGAIQSIITTQYFDSETANKVLELSSVNFDANQYMKELELLVETKFVTHHSGKGKTKKVTVNQQVREKAFSDNIRKNYQYTCSVCKARVQTPTDNYIVEGAHIIPWGESYNDDPRNGISLCRNHHWLFDRSMMTIRPNFTVQLSPWLKKKINQWDEYQTILDSEILLPSDSKFYPAIEALQHHNEEFEKAHKNI